MNRLDLIIDALSFAQNSVWSKLNEQALAAARELKALAQEQTKCPRCGEVNPAEIHTCSPQVAQPEQDKQCKHCGGKGCVACDARCLPKREWVGLHLDDIPETFVGDWSFLEGARWAGAKLKEKNSGS